MLEADGGGWLWNEYLSYDISHNENETLPMLFT